ncbi:MAG TPA: hypothetical protein VIO11_09775 [Candidatus Methanoperedens sp.]
MISGKKLILFVLVFAILILAWFAPLQQSKYVHIVGEVLTSQEAAEKNTEMEIVKVHGTFWNDGNLAAENLTATVIFTDTAHNKVVRKTVLVGGNLLPDKGNAVEFNSEYLRERTVPKTAVNITEQFEWMENGQLKNSSI